ncbi:hypothetical protein ACEE58_11380 [Streptococcus pluranimalium]
MRNLWMIMKTFNVLPTDERFRNLTDDQVELIMESMVEDARIAELHRKGLTVDAQYYDDDFDEEVWSKPEGEWEILRPGHDPDEIYRQVQEITKSEDLENLDTKFDSLQEYNDYLEGGGKPVRETEVEQYINQRIAEAEDKARRLSYEGKKAIDDKDRPKVADNNALSDNNTSDLDKQAIDDGIALFNSMDDDDDFTPL